MLDLGTAPPSNAYLTAEQLRAPELWLPLKLLVCAECWLVQTEDYTGREALFTEDYAYFSSVSSSWLTHARDYVEQVCTRFSLDHHSTVVEVASNDGYLLQFVRDRGIPCYGIEPTRCTAAVARAKGLDVITEFFGQELAVTLVRQGRPADLIVANNVLAHVPDINSFVAGFASLLRPDGVATFEFPHLLRMILEGQFDTAYHEHFSYLSLFTVSRIFGANGLGLFDVEELSTHGGSLRVYAQRLDTGRIPVTSNVQRVLRQEQAVGMQTWEFYKRFQGVAETTKNNLLAFLLDARRRGHAVAGYGAAAKASTLLNFAGIGPDLLRYIVDRSSAKVGKYMPGCRIPIVDESEFSSIPPDHIIVLPWNIKEEVARQLEPLRREIGCNLLVVVPRLEFISNIRHAESA
jgi:SAM-dependent methyltransferase